MQRTIHFTIDGSANEIRGVFEDLKQYCTFHPLIIDAILIEDKEGKKAYTVIEKPFTWFPLKIRYKAIIHSISSKKIEYQISEIPFTNGTIVYTFNYDLSNHQMNIIFDLTLKSKLPGKRILLNKMIAAQNELMEALGTAMRQEL